MEGQPISHYIVDSRIGAGGMGVVYKAWDIRLNRTVALKFLAPDLTRDPAAKARFIREARSASALDHPHITTIHEIDETSDGQLFLVMAYYEGPTLEQKLVDGPLQVEDAIQIAVQIADGLSEAHSAGIVHCDIKPANVMFTSRGTVKIVDFGIAKLTQQTATTAGIGIVAGTLPYMSPEHLDGIEVDARADVWSLGVVLYEMLTGRRPFTGDAAALTAAILQREPPPLVGARPGVPASLDVIVRRALAKRRDDRIQSSADFASALRSFKTTVLPEPRHVTRLIVLPFHILRPDAEIDFLSFSLPDAITASLVGLESLQVRSSAMAAKFGERVFDLSLIAREADVDLVLRGTLLRAGQQIRVNTELLEPASGSTVWTQSADVTTGDLFALLDDLTGRIVDAVSVPLTAREQRRLGRDVPSSADAFANYLQANRLSQDVAQWSAARALYEQALAADSNYAPAWARLGRVCWLMGKYISEKSRENLSRAQFAFETALRVNPDLAITHHLLTPLEVDIGRAIEAMKRLVTRATEHPTDAELFAGLVHACRYCGLLNASLAADARAHRIDPKLATSALQTRFHRGEYAFVALQDINQFPVAVSTALIHEGRDGEAASKLDVFRHRDHRLRDFADAIRALAQGRTTDSLLGVERIVASGFRAPEELYHLARILARLGAIDHAVVVLDRAVTGGFYSLSTLKSDPWLAPVRDREDGQAVLARAQERHQHAADVFRGAGGEALLGQP